MSIIIYGGVKERVEQQLKCGHDWYNKGEASIDEVSRFRKCSKCFCYERDLESEKEYWEAVNR